MNGARRRLVEVVAPIAKRRTRRTRGKAKAQPPALLLLAIAERLDLAAQSAIESLTTGVRRFPESLQSWQRLLRPRLDSFGKKAMGRSTEQTRQMRAVPRETRDWRVTVSPPG